MLAPLTPKATPWSSRRCCRRASTVMSAELRGDAAAAHHTSRIAENGEEGIDAARPS